MKKTLDQTDDNENIYKMKRLTFCIKFAIMKFKDRSTVLIIVLFWCICLIGISLRGIEFSSRNLSILSERAYFQEDYVITNEYPTIRLLRSSHWESYYGLTFYPGSLSEFDDAETRICLATHCTLDHLHWLSQQASSFESLISVSVFISKNNSAALPEMVEYLRVCFPKISKNIIFSLVFQDNILNQLDSSTIHMSVNCQTSLTLFIENFLIERKHSDQFLYPQNLMRNIARETCTTNFTVSVDIDMITNQGLGKSLNEFLSRSPFCPKCAYIIPVYEISKEASFPPHNKSELLELIKQKKSRRYHIKVYDRNQNNTNLPKWEQIKSQDSELLNILYNVTTFQDHWEPIVVLHKSAPGFLERFIGYGFTRNSHIYLLNKLNYSFVVLDNAFLSHLGFQTTNQYSKERNNQISENSIKYTAFKKILKNGIPENLTAFVLEN